MGSEKKFFPIQRICQNFGNRNNPLQFKNDSETKMAENLGPIVQRYADFGRKVNKTGTKLLIYHGRVFMVDMKNFTLTKHDDELYAIIKPVKQYSSEHKILAVWGIDCLSRFLPVLAKYQTKAKSFILR